MGKFIKNFKVDHVKRMTLKYKSKVRRLTMTGLLNQMQKTKSTNSEHKSSKDMVAWRYV